MNAVLRDGGSVHVRAIRADDWASFRDHFQRMSDRAVYLRFFAVKRRFSEEEVRRFTDLDFVSRVGLVATLRERGEEHIIGMAHYMVTPTVSGQPKCAEVAFSVADAHQGRGIGTLLLEELARIAESNGIHEFEAHVLGENNRMLEVFGAS